MRKNTRTLYIMIGVLFALFISVCTCFIVIATGYAGMDTDALTITSNSAVKVYDGTPLTDEGYSVEGKLQEGHHVAVSTYGSQTKVGFSKNRFHYTIVDSDGNSVSHEYRVIEKEGWLAVYDQGMIEGLDFNKEDLEKLDGNLNLEGIKEEFDWENIPDDKKQELLEKLAGAIGSAISGGSGGGGDSGAGGEGGEGDGGQGNTGSGFSPSLQNQGSGFGEGAETEVLEIYAPKTKSYYLRYESFGDYTGSGFEYADEYTDAIVSPNYFAGFALFSSGILPTNVTVRNLSENNLYYMPYYSITGLSEKGDIYFKTKQKEYIAPVCDYDYLSSSASLNISESLLEYEAGYKKFAYDNYLQIDPYLKSELKRITGFTGSKKSLIAQIKNYVQNAATYNLNFAAFPEGEDMVLYFLTQGKEGICQHFAASATMMLRAYGIPARYTAGFKANAKENEWTKVTAKYAHAWVEVYVDGFGWVMLEVTGSDYDLARQNVLELKTPSIDKVYDGKRITEEEAISWEITKGYLQNGHRIVVSDTATLSLPMYAGEYDNDDFGYKILDENDNDVTSKYNVTNISYGKLKISKRPIIVTFDSRQAEYTGSAISLSSATVQNLAETDSFIITGENQKISIGTHDNILEYTIRHIFPTAGQRTGDLKDQYEIIENKGQLTVTKIELFVYTLDKEKEYDKTPLYDTDVQYDYSKVLSGNFVQVNNGYTKITEPSSVTNIFTISVVDVYGRDVTDDYYNVIYGYDNGTAGKLTVKKREIVVKTANAETTLSNLAGGYISAPSFEIVSGSVLSGDTLSVTNYKTVSELGKYSNSATVKITRSSVDITDQYYNVTVNQGIIWVYISEFTIETGSAEKPYDGTPLACPGYVITSGEISSEHKISDQITTTSITEIGKKDNGFDGTFVILEIATGEIVPIEHYKINYQLGTLTIKDPLVDLVIKTGSSTKEYDGERVVYEEFTTEGLLDGHRVVAVNNSTSVNVINPGDVDDNVFDVIIVDGEGNDVSDQYKVSFDYGTLEVVRKSITITTKDGESKLSDLNGGGLSVEDYTVSGEVALGDVLVIDNFAIVSTLGRHYNIASVKVMRGGEDVTSTYYDLTVDYGILWVYVEDIQILTGSSEEKFTGQTISKESYQFLVSSGSLISGDEIEVAGYPSLNQLGSISNVPDSIRIVRNGIDVTNEYKFSVLYGKLRLYVDDLTFSTSSAEKLYDGDPLKSEKYTMTGNLALGHEVIVEYPSITEIGSIPNEFTSFMIIDIATGVNVTEHYNIEFASIGTLTVYSANRTKISVESKSLTKVYDGKPLCYDQTAVGSDYYSLTSGSLKAGHSIVVRAYASITDVGERSNEMTFRVVDGEGNDVTYLYEITPTFGKLKVISRSIVITTADKQAIYYDGIVLKGSNADVSSYLASNPAEQGILVVEGHTFNATFAEGISTPGTCENVITQITIFDASGKNVTNNYSISYEYGFLKITL